MLTNRTAVLVCGGGQKVDCIVMVVPSGLTVIT